MSATLQKSPQIGFHNNQYWFAKSRDLLQQQNPVCIIRFHHCWISYICRILFIILLATEAADRTIARAYFVKDKSRGIAMLGAFLHIIRRELPCWLVPCLPSMASIHATR